MRFDSSVSVILWMVSLYAGGGAAVVALSVHRLVEPKFKDVSQSY